MSRTDQYIGLTRDAESYVSGLDKLGTSELVGAFGNVFKLGIWAAPDKFPPGTQIKERVQECPWSSGPMFFTCLAIIWPDREKTMIFCWVLDPTVDAEVDFDRGHYWI